MVDTHRILPAYTLHRENAQIFLNPCHHILHSIICLELRGTYPTYGRSSSSIDFVQQSPLWTAQCRRCCTKRSLNFQVLWIIVPNKLFFKLFDSSPKPSSDFCHVILPPPLGIYEIDHSGYRLVAHHLCRYIILQEAMTWLSTLGGGFSCLGDKFEDAVRYSYVYTLKFH